MASNINANNIDGTYPIAGQDNDSQGFRTNFTNIKNNFTFAKTELDDLQAKVVLKNSLTGTSLDNNMAGSLFYGAEVRDLRETRVDLGSTVSGTVTLNHTSGHYYTAILTGNTTLAFSGFTNGKIGRIRFEVNVGSGPYTLTLPSSVSLGLKGIAGINSSRVITFSETGTYIFEFTSDDGGTVIHVQDLSRPRDYFHSTQIALAQRTPIAVGQSGDIAGMIAVNGNYIYVCTGTYDGSTAIWKRASISSF